MQMPTHFLVSILFSYFIQKIFPTLPIIGIYFIVAICAFMSHIFLDVMAKLTYHPPEADFHDKFWVIYHTLVYLAAIIIIILWIQDFWWAMLWGIMPDIWDWGIFRYLVKRPPTFHPYIDKIRNRIFGWAPEWTDRKITVIGEWVVNAVLFVSLLLLTES